MVTRNGELDPWYSSGIAASDTHYLQEPYNPGFLEFPVVTAMHVVLGGLISDPCASSRGRPRMLLKADPFYGWGEGDYAGMKRAEAKGERMDS